MQNSGADQRIAVARTHALLRAIPPRVDGRAAGALVVGSGDESSEDFSGPEPTESVTNFCKSSHLSASPRRSSLLDCKKCTVQQLAEPADGQYCTDARPVHPSLPWHETKPHPPTTKISTQPFILPALFRCQNPALVAALGACRSSVELSSLPCRNVMNQVSVRFAA